MANPNGRPRSETVKLTKTAREHFDRQLAEKLPDIFTALFEAGTKEKDTAALSLLVNRAVPVRKGVPVNFKTRPLSNPPECAEAPPFLEALGLGGTGTEIVIDPPASSRRGRYGAGLTIPPAHIPARRPFTFCLPLRPRCRGISPTQPHPACCIEFQL